MDKKAKLTKRLQTIEKVYPVIWVLCSTIPIPIAIMTMR